NEEKNNQKPEKQFRDGREDFKDSPYPSDKNSPKKEKVEVKEKLKKLNQAKISNDKKELVNALKETQNTTQNSSDEDLKKQKEQIENRLGQVDQEKLRRIIKEELTELNNSQLKPEKVKNIHTEVLNKAGVITLEKLIAEVQQTIKLNNQKSIKSKVKKLKIFVENTANEYAQNAYQQKKE
ncbi:15162_t:CDS:2, partial [Funneliformis geosporum]